MNRPGMSQALTLPRGAASAYSLTYAGLWLFTLMVYLRPNDLLPIGGLRIVRIIGLAMLFAFVLEQPRGRGLSVMPVEFKYLLGLTGLMLAAIPLALDPVGAMNVFFEVLKAVLIFMAMINAVNSLERLRRLLTLTVICGTIIAIGSAYDYASGVGLVYDRMSGIVGGMFQNPNDLALALNMLIPIAIGLALISREPLIKLWYVGCASCLSIAVVLTVSRAGFLTLLVVGGFLLRRFVRHPSKAVVLAGLAGLVLLLMAPSAFWFRILTLFDPAGDANAAGSATIRWEILLRSLQIALNPKVWVLGIGMGNFHIVSLYERVHHNAYLEVFNEVGVPALVLYLLFLFGSFKTMGRIAVTHERDGARPPIALLAGAIQGSLLAYAVGSFFASVAYLYYLYYAVGFAVCLRLLVDGDRLPEGVKRPGRRAPLGDPRAR